MRKLLKNFAGLTIAASMILSLFIPLSLQAAEEEEAVNHIPNGGFEELDENGYPVDWFQFKSGGWQDWNPAQVSVSKEVVHSGENALYVYNSGNTGASLVGAWVQVHGGEEGFIPNAIYEFSFYYNAELESTNGGVKLYTECYTGEDFRSAETRGQGLPSLSEANRTSSTSKLWVKASKSFTIQEAAKTLVFYIGIWGTAGEAYFDDCSIKMAEGPTPYTMDTDDVFMYPDQEKSRAVVTLDSFYKMEEAKDIRIDFKLYDPEDGKVLKEQKDTPIEEYKSVFEYETSLLTQMQKQYQIKAIWRNSVTGEELGGQTRNVYRYPRPGMIEEDGTIIMDGKPFIPMFAYHLFEADWDEAKAMGVNITGTSYTNDPDNLRDQLDRIHEAGLKAYVSLRTAGLMGDNGTDEAIQIIQSLVSAVQDHPAIWAYCPHDEPMGSGATDEKREKLERAYRAIRDIDSYHPVYYVDYAPGFRQTWKYCDIFARDLYAYRDSYSAKITAGMTETAALVDGKKPLMNILLTQKGSTMKAIRASMFRTMVVGCQGLGNYTYSNYEGDGGMVQRPFHDFDTYEPTKRMLAEEMPLLWKHFADGQGTRFSLFESDPTGGEGVYLASWVDDGVLYYVLHNRNNSEQTISAPLISSNGKVKIDGFAAEPIGLTGVESFTGSGALEFTMHADEVIFLKIKPDAAINEAVLSETSAENHAIPKGYQPKNEIASDNTGFADLGAYEWARESIETLYKDGVVNSLNTYMPGQAITRGDAAMYLIRTLGLSGEDAEAFSDVPADAYYAKEITAGRALGLFNGVGENLFNPSGLISRQDLMVISARAMRLVKKLGATADVSVLDAFSDKDMISDYAKEDFAAVVEAGIIQGDGTGANPRGNTTRAEAAVIMHRIRNAPEVESEKSTKPEDVETPEIPLPEETLSEKQVNTREKAEKLLKALGVLDEAFDSKKAVTKADVAAAINGIYKNEAVQGDHSPAIYHETVRALLDAMGYGVYAKAAGGNTVHYISIASREGLLEGITLSASDTVSGSAFALLLKNALEMNLVERSEFGEGASANYETRQGETLLSEYLHVSKKRGILTEEYFGANGVPTRVGRNVVVIDGVQYDCGKTNAADYFGQEVIIYTADDPDKNEAIILYIEAARSVTVTKVESENILPNTSLTQMVYEENGEEKEAGIRTDAKFIYNGREKTREKILLDGDMRPASGTVTLIANSGGDADVVLIESYENHAVKSTSALQNMIYFKDGSTLAADTDDTKNRVQLLKADGTEAKLSDFQEWNIVSVMQSEDKTVKKAVLSNTTAKGVVSEISDNEVIINGGVYKVAPGFDMSLFQLGKEQRFAMDFMGRIAGETGSGSDVEYGYLMAAQNKTGIEDVLSVKILTAGNKMTVFTAADKFTFNRNPATPGEVMKSLTGEDGKTVLKQMVSYEVNSEGNITALQTWTDGSSMKPEARQGIFTRDYYADNNVYLLKDPAVFLGKYRMTSSTVFFLTPKTDTGNDKDYRVVSASELEGGYMFDANSTAFFDINEDNTISAIQMTTGSTSVEIPKFSATHAVITGRTTILNEDGEVIKGFKVLTPGAVERVLEIPDELEFGFSLPSNFIGGTITTQEDINKVGTFTAEDLEVGDVIQFETSSGDTVSVARVLFRVGPKAEIQSGNGTMGRTGEYWNYNNITFNFGTVTKTFSHSVMMKSNFEHMYVRSVNMKRKFPLIIFDEKKGTFTVSTDNELQVGDKLFVSRQYTLDQLWICYR